MQTLENFSTCKAIRQTFTKVKQFVYFLAHLRRDSQVIR